MSAPLLSRGPTKRTTSRCARPRGGVRPHAPSLPPRDVIDTAGVNDVVAQETRRYHTARLDRADLQQAARVGVAEAARRFDPSKGPFTAYARLWVRKELQRALGNGEFAVSLPADYPRRAVLIRQVVSESPSIADAGARLGLPEDAVEPLLAIVEARSLDDLTDERPVPAADHLEDEVIERMEADVIAAAVAGLPGRLRSVVVLAYGFDGGGVRSAREIGRIVGVSDFTVRADLVRAHASLRVALDALRSPQLDTVLVD